MSITTTVRPLPVPPPALTISMPINGRVVSRCGTIRRSISMATTRLSLARVSSPAGVTVMAKAAAVVKRVMVGARGPLLCNLA